MDKNGYLCGHSSICFPSPNPSVYNPTNIYLSLIYLSIIYYLSLAFRICHLSVIFYHVSSMYGSIHYISLYLLSIDISSPIYHWQIHLPATFLSGNLGRDLDWELPQTGKDVHIIESAGTRRVHGWMSGLPLSVCLISHTAFQGSKGHHTLMVGKKGQSKTHGTTDDHGSSKQQTIHWQLEVNTEGDSLWCSYKYGVVKGWWSNAAWTCY